MDDRYQEVYFDEYCEKCEHKNLKEGEDPCFGCLEHPVNLYSHKPVNYKPKAKDNKTAKD